MDTPAVDARWHRRIIRNALGSIATLALVGGLAATATSATAAAPRTATVSRASIAYASFTARLDDDQRAALAGGIAFGDLSADQRDHLMRLARSLLSEKGFAEFLAVMAADDALDAAAGGGTEYASEHYRVLAIDDAVGGAFIQLGGTQLAINARLGRDGVWVEPDLV